MLDSTTKKRIDDCRDILVGKLPDPKSQIEQITIALIYKFMDDMDKEAVELGGTPKFFSGDYAKFGWDRLFDAQLGSADMLTLYALAIESMGKNPNIPQLFRDIFKNAYLPYRDPATLKMFLKTIGEFSYGHSEMLGDAFEYLLSIMGSQGDAGQFRTPRHIIDFLVEVVDPKKEDTILDPACGTAGFLISAFKHILKQNKGNLTPDQRKKLMRNVVGYDISPDMQRLALVNLYLHGFNDPHIHEYDTLSSEERWDETYDVILANPPFMTPKGGIRPHKKFGVQSNRSEVLFVDYIAEHLNTKGRAGIIVPEGIIFQSGTAYKDLRKTLVTDHLYAVISLPAGVFNPYSGVKTSILLLDRETAKRNDSILFVKVDNDGYNLGAQRSAVKGGQLDDAVELVEAFRKENFTNSPIAHAVAKSAIAESGDYNLSGERYKVQIQYSSSFPIVEMDELVKIRTGKKDVNEGNPAGIYPFFTCARENTFSDDYSFDDEVILVAGNGDVGAVKYYKGKFEAYQRTYILFDFQKVLPKYLYYHLLINFREVVQKLKLGNTMPYIKLGMLKEFRIPLPPLSVQEEIVAEIEGYQKIIDGARMVVENYRPQITIDPDWEMVELGKVCEITSSKRIFMDEYVSKGVPFYRTKEIVELNAGQRPSLELYISEDRYNEIRAKNDVPVKGDILLSAVGTLGVSWVVDHDLPFYFKDGNLVWLKDIQGAHSEYLKLVLDVFIPQQLHILAAGAAYKALTIVKLKEMRIPLPTINTQRMIVDQVNTERNLVNSNKQLISIFEGKIKERIDRVWGVGKVEKEKESETETAVN